MNHYEIEEIIRTLKFWRSGWDNDIREGWNCAMDGAKDIHATLCQVAAEIILAFEDIQEKRRMNKTLLLLAHEKLTELVKSNDFQDFDLLGQQGVTNVVTNATKHHIRVMFELLQQVLQ